MLKTLLLAVLILACTAVAAFLLVGRARTWEMLAGNPDPGQYDFGANRRSPTPNDALACSPGLCADADFEIAPVAETPPAAIERLAHRLLAIDPLARRLDDRKNPARARFVTYSPLMRFPDLIHLEARPLPDGRTGIMAYARAQLGSSDMGKNLERLRALFDAR